MRYTISTLLLSILVYASERREVMEMEIKIEENTLQSVRLPADAEVTKMTVKDTYPTKSGAPQLWICKELKWIGIKPGDKVMIYKDRNNDRLIISKI